MTTYVLGFAFDLDGAVALIRKTKPAWQRGKLNGIGGKVEFRELPVEAMEREFLEETGLIIPAIGWREFAVMQSGPHLIHCFTARFMERDVPLISGEEGKADWYHPKSPGGRPGELPNLTWLIPMALLDESAHAKIVYAVDPLEKAVA